MTSIRTQIDSLTGLRAIAALWVMLMHFREITPLRVWHFPLVDPVIENGACGVEIFFVLSGFILSYVYASEFSTGVNAYEFKKFMIFRFARIYPIHIITFIAMSLMFLVNYIVSIEHSASYQRYDFLTVITTLSLTHAWIPGIQTPNMPAWSISAEWFAYILFPVLCFCMFIKRWVAIIFAILGLGCAYIETRFHNDLIYVLSGFLVGMAAYYFTPVIRQLTDTCPFAGFVVTIGIFVWAYAVSPNAEIGLFLFAIFIITLTNPRDWISRVLGVRSIVYLGEISYSLYMVHWLVRVVLRDGLRLIGVLNKLPSAMVVGVYIGGTVIAAVLCYHFIELPGRTVLRRIGTRIRWVNYRPKLSA